MDGDELRAAARTLLNDEAVLSEPHHAYLARNLARAYLASIPADDGEAKLTPIWLLQEVWRQAGNDAPAGRRHALTGELRDNIRDYLKSIDALPGSDLGIPTEAP